MKAWIDQLIDEPVGMQIAPLIDVVFLLLIYFMVTASLKKQEADLGIHLPGAVAQAQSVLIPDEQIVDVLADGSIVLNGQIFAPGSGHDLPELFHVLLRYKQASDLTNTKALVTIQAEDDALHQRVIDVMNACAGAGIRHVTFGMDDTP